MSLNLKQKKEKEKIMINGIHKIRSIVKNILKNGELRMLINGENVNETMKKTVKQQTQSTNLLIILEPQSTKY
jgi:hypothetical protein